MTAGKAVLFTIVLLALLGAWALVRRSRDARELYDTLAAGPVEVADPQPAVVVLPDGFTCLGCFETDALPNRVWCAVCSERAANFPAEPIERGGLEGCIARHPAGKQRKTGGDQ